MSIFYYIFFNGAAGERIVKYNQNNSSYRGRNLTVNILNRIESNSRIFRELNTCRGCIFKIKHLKIKYIHEQSQTLFEVIRCTSSSVILMLSVYPNDPEHVSATLNSIFGKSLSMHYLRMRKNVSLIEFYSLSGLLWAKLMQCKTQPSYLQRNLRTTIFI